MDKNLKEIIGNKIKQFRETKGLTQRQLGEMVNKSYSTICSLEKGKRNVTLKTLEDIASVLKIEVSEFLEYPLEQIERPDIIKEAGEHYDIPEYSLDFFSENFKKGVCFQSPQDYYYLWIFMDAMNRKKG